MTVPEGYTVQVIAPWGDPVGMSGENAAFKDDASNSAAQQATQFGMHHDGIHYFAQEGSKVGLLAMNHEYGPRPAVPRRRRQLEPGEGAQVAGRPRRVDLRSAGKERQVGGGDPSPWARRITANTPTLVSGPAAGHALMKTAADPQGARCWAPQQLRQRHHALGYVPHV